MTEFRLALVWRSVLLLRRQHFLHFQSSWGDQSSFSNTLGAPRGIPLLDVLLLLGSTRLPSNGTTRYCYYILQANDTTYDWHIKQLKETKTQPTNCLNADKLMHNISNIFKELDELQHVWLFKVLITINSFCSQSINLCFHEDWLKMWPLTFWECLQSYHSDRYWQNLFIIFFIIFSARAVRRVYMCKLGIRETFYTSLNRLHLLLPNPYNCLPTKYNITVWILMNQAIVILAF